MELTIKQAAEQTNLSEHTLRYYERIGLISGVARAPGGRRLYSTADINWILFLKRLKTTGMSLADMKKYALFKSRGDSTFQARKQLLLAHRNSVRDSIKILQANMREIDKKIEYYAAKEKN